MGGDGAGGALYPSRIGPLRTRLEPRCGGAGTISASVPRMSAVRSLLLAAALAAPALFAGAPAARSAPLEWDPPARFAALPGQVAAGDEVELRWSEVPGETEELELLLSLDDGRTFRVRVSPELEGGTRHYLWRVPNLPAERARLRLRVGDREHESEGAVSAAFQIVGMPGMRPELQQVHEGNWWSGLDSEWEGGASEFAPAGPRATIAAAEDEALAPPPRPPGALAPGLERLTRSATRVASQLARSPQSPRSRRFQPLRN